MIRKIIFLISLVFLNGCYGIGFEKGVFYEKKYGYNYDYNNQSKLLIVHDSNNKVTLTVYKNECGSYGMIGLIIPLIPIWNNHDCNKDVAIGVSSATNVYLKYNDQIYQPSNISKIKTYTFPISVKSLSGGATLIIEKDGEKFEIPFRYQHTFNFELWGT